MANDLQVIKEQAYQAFAAGNLTAALALLEQVRLSIGLYAELANDLAVVHYKLGDTPSALQLFRQALALQGESEHLVANNLLGILEQQCQQPELPPSQPSQQQAVVAAVSNSQPPRFIHVLYARKPMSRLRLFLSSTGRMHGTMASYITVRAR